MDEKMHFMTEPEELLNWMKEHEEFKVMNKEDAQILLNYMEGHDYRLGTDKDGSLVRVDINTDEYEAEQYSLDDVIDIVCEWNDELIRYTSQELNELSQGQDKSSLEVKLASLKQDEIRLDKMFEQTKYPAEIEALAVQLADAFIASVGKAVIGSNIGGIPTLIEDGKSGLLFECGNVEELSKKIDEIIDKSDLLQEYGDELKKNISKKYSFQDNMNKIKKIYSTLGE